MKYSLSPDCKLVLGKDRAAIYDLRRCSIILIPLPLARILSNSLIGIDQLPDEFLEIFNQLVRTQYFFLRGEIPFDSISTEDRSISLISNCIIEYESYLPFRYIANELQSLCCEHISFIIYRSKIEEVEQDVLLFLETVKSAHIAIHMIYSDDTANYIQSSLLPTSGLSSLTLYCSPCDKVEFFEDCRIVYSRTEFNLCSQCIDFKLILNHRFYNESLHHNNCLYKKLVISGDGSLSNCPLSCERFGTVFNGTSILEVIMSRDFQKNWDLSKDLVEGCRDCELRYACLDCRYANQKKFSLDKPHWCNYHIEDTEKRPNQ